VLDKSASVPFASAGKKALQQLPRESVGLYRNPQIRTRHLFRFIDSEHSQDRRRNIAQGSVRLQREFPGIFRHHNKGYGVGSMRGMRPAGPGIDHHLRIAMIGGDQHRSAFRPNRGFNPAQASVDRFDRFDRRLYLSRMPDHVGVGKVHDHDVERPFLRSLHHRVGNA
jgi:hypothetical protein